MTWLARRGLWCAAALTVLVACSPALDWRDVRPPGTALTLQFPCRPVAQQRAVALAGPAVSLALLACTAGGQTWALVHADMVDPARVGNALSELRSLTLAKLNAADGVGPALPLAVPGATPNAHSVRMRLRGQAAASSASAGAVQMEMALFAYGTQVFQASVLGREVPVDSAEAFFESLGFKS